MVITGGQQWLPFLAFVARSRQLGTSDEPGDCGRRLASVIRILRLEPAVGGRGLERSEGGTAERG